MGFLKKLKVRTIFTMFIMILRVFYVIYVKMGLQSSCDSPFKDFCVAISSEERFYRFVELNLNFK